MKRFGPVMRLHALYVLFAMIINILMLQEGFSSTEGTTLRMFSGQPLNAAFGQSVANAGDVNGDGFSDLVIGALYNFEGRVYIYFGGASVDTIPDVLLNYRMSNDRFGGSVAGAGDVNGDGYADVIVGAQQSGSLGTDSGHVYIYFGGAVMDSVPDFVAAGLPGELFGKSVAAAGDVNNDGYADVIVGAYGSDAAGLDVGRAYIFFGGATVDNFPDVTITGTVITEDLGYSVASAGDVNNDSYDDVIVGAYTNDLAGGNNSGKAYLYLGGSPMNNVVDVTFNGSAAFDYFGTCVAGAGDVNNDGYDDILISAPENTQRGRTSVYLGGSVMNNVPDVTLRGEGSTNYFGNSAASAGDINGDGFADVIIGAFGNNSSTGKAYIYYGGASMDTIPDLTFIGEATSDRFGGSVTGTGDVNGDGFSDVIVGAIYGGVTDKGRAYLYLSTGGPLPIQLASLTATQIEPRKVRLDWTTVSEVNNYGFYIERRPPHEVSFTTVSSLIPGAGTTLIEQQYNWIDENISEGVYHYRIRQMDLNGEVSYSYEIEVTVYGAASVDNEIAPREFALYQNYPNPFNPSTTIEYQLPLLTHVTLKVYDVTGRAVATLVDERQDAGYKTVQLNATGLASGVYVYKLVAGDFVETKKTLFLK